MAAAVGIGVHGGAEAALGSVAAAPGGLQVIGE